MTGREKEGRRDVKDRRRIVTRPLELDKVKGGHYRPVDLCQFHEILRRWRDESSRSSVLVR